MRVLTIYHINLGQSTALEQKRFDLLLLLPALRNPWIFTSLNNIPVYQQYSDSSFVGALHVAYTYYTLHLENKYDQYVIILKVRRKKWVSTPAVGDF